MNFSAIILVILACYLVYKINTKNQTGGSVKKIIKNEKDPYYLRQYQELEDVDNVLLRPQEMGNTNIQNLVTANKFKDYEKELKIPTKKYLDFIDKHFR